MERAHQLTLNTMFSRLDLGKMDKVVFCFLTSTHLQITVFFSRDVSESVKGPLTGRMIRSLKRYPAVTISDVRQGYSYLLLG